MKKLGINIAFPTLLTILFFCGCFEYHVEIADPNQQMVMIGSGENAVILPQASPDPRKNNKVPETVAQSPAKKTVPEVKEDIAAAKTEKNTPEKIQAPPVDARQKVKSQPADDDKKFRRGPWMWRAFSRLPKEEQQKLLKLQRSDPERYREIILAKANELYALEEAKKDVIDKLAARYQAATSAEEKKALSGELRLKLKEDFQQKLADTRGDIESYKRRTIQLEAELQKREQNCDAIIDALLESKLEEKK